MLIIILLISQTIVFKISEVEAISKYSDTSDKDFNNGTLNNIEIISSGIDACLRLKNFESESINWTELDLQVQPKPRSEYGFASIWNTDKVLLFGGGYDWFDLNDTWIFDYSQNLWFNMKPKNSPPSMFGPGLSSIFGTDKVLLFGGCSHVPSKGGVLHNETWLYDLSENNWTKIIPNSESPPGRREPSISFFWNEDKLLLFGGSGKSYEIMDFNDTWIYDYSENIWINKSDKTSPVGRRSRLSPLWNYDKVLLFGGDSRTLKGNVFEDKYYNDTWIYDLSEDNWKKMEPLKSPAKRSGFGFGSIYGTDKVLLFGGSLTFFDSYLNDTWIYSYSNNSWIKKDPDTNPINRADTNLATIYGTDKLLLFSGWISYNGSTGLYKYGNDTWIFNINKYETIGSYISSIHNIPGNSSFKRIKWKSSIHPDTELKFQIKTSALKSGLNFKDFSGPDGKVDSYYVQQDLPILLNEGDEKWLQYKVIFLSSNSTNTPVLYNFDIVYNKWPIAPILKNPQNNSWFNHSRFYLNWIFKDNDDIDQGGFQIQIDDSLEFQNILFDSNKIISSITTYMLHIPLNPGEYFWRVKTWDKEDDFGPFSEIFKFTIDKESPSSKIIFPTNSFYYSDIDFISGKANDNNQECINEIKIIIKNLTGNRFWNGTNWLLNETWLLANGTSTWIYNSSNLNWHTNYRYMIRSRAKDKAGNYEKSDKNTIINIDLTAPNSSLQYPSNNSYLNELKLISGLSFDLNGSGIKSNEICIEQIIDNNYWNGKEWVSDESWIEAEGKTNWHYNSSTIPWNSDNWYNIYSRSFDNVRNREKNVKLNTYMFDNSSPECDLIINNNDFFTNNLSVNLNILSNDSGSGTEFMAFNFNNEIWTEWEYFNKIKNYTLKSGDGEKNIYLRTKDRARNIANTVHDSIILDMTAPENLSIKINNGDNITKMLVVNLNLSAVDKLSGLNKMTFSSDGVNWSDWENYSNTKMYLLPEGNGQKNIYFIVTDIAGNIAEPVSTSILLNEMDFWYDSDGDSYPNDIDDFPNDPAASKDTDKDGYPDYWNKGKNEQDSITGLQIDCFPNDPAASIDTDMDNYPDSWNLGKSNEDSTTGLELDELPNDPSRHKNDESDDSNNRNNKGFIYSSFLSFYLLILLILLIIIILSIQMKIKLKRMGKPYNENKDLRKVRNNIINGKYLLKYKISHEEIQNKLEEKRKVGELKDNDYENIKELINN
jgi:hypothetical protein